jgi:ATP-binding cassette subfamily F protein 3
MGFGLAFGAVDKSSHEMLRFSDLRKSFGKPVLNGLDFEVRRDDRIGLVGANGAGKSTLLKILTGREKHDSGSIHVAPGVKGIFFSQEHDDLEPKRTLKDEVLDARPALEERDVKALLGRFRFNPDHDLGRSVSTLSGGERQRLMLLKCVLKPSNLLILDEPTNHLDLWARDVVVQALNAYHGTIIVVSHDRFLLDACTTTTAVLQQGMLHQYAGSFTQSRDQHKAPADEKSSIVKCVVQKRFTDWTNKRKFAREEEVEFTEATLRGSPTLRNAISQGWLVRLDS